MKKRLLSALLAALIVCGCVLCGCSNGSDPVENKTAKQSTDKYRNFYEIFTQSFNDSNGDGTGDLQGIIDKLDYLKALGFSAIWITPVVTNGGGYDYHGYHSMDMSTVDVRYESEGATYQDLIDAAHAKDMKIVQDVVWNHTGNWGDAFFCPMAIKQYTKIQDLASPDSMKLIPDGELAKAYPNYASLSGAAQFQARLDILQDLQHNGHNSKE